MAAGQMNETLYVNFNGRGDNIIDIPPRRSFYIRRKGEVGQRSEVQALR